MDICKAIVRYAYRTGERVILNNASQEGAFKDNPEVQLMQLRSVLCLPVLKQSKMIGVLYLENRLSEAVFTWEKTQMTELLTSQAAISLENARLVSESRHIALRERMASEINSKVWASATIDGVLQTVVKELGRRLDASSATIELHIDDSTKEEA